MATSISSGTIYGTTNAFNIKVYASQQNISISNNTSEIDWYVNMQVMRSMSGVTLETEISINGQKFNSEQYFDSISSGSSYKIWRAGENIVTVPHNADGTKTINISVLYSFNYDGGYARYNTNWTLDPIPREAYITSAPNFNDEENPTINYSAPYSSNYTSLQACISFTGSKDDIPYRDIPKNGTSYTFNLTNAERRTLRKAFDNQEMTRSVRFYVRTIMDGKTYYSTLDRTLSLINYLPELSPTVIDTNALTVKLTGDNTKLIKFFSNAYFTTGATAKKEATIFEQTIVCGSQHVDNVSSGTITGIDSNIFYFRVRDSRGYAAEEYLLADTIAYTKPTCNIRSLSLSSNGELSFTISGNYFNSSFGAKDNSLEFECGYRKDGGNIVWMPFEATPTLNGNTYTLTHTLTGFDYSAQYSICFNITDKLSNAQSPFRVAGSISIFDWGKNDFRHNTDVYYTYGTTLHTENTYGSDVTIIDPCNEENRLTIGKGNYDAGIGSTDIWGNTVNINGKAYGENKVLWSGAYCMDASQTIPLSEPISSQPNGIVLVFSGYDNDSHVAQDSSINTFFVSKKQVELFSSVGHTFLLGINAEFGGMAAKYLYFEDTQISGHSGNTSAGTNSGITYNNGNYVLRYVIGV